MAVRHLRLALAVLLLAALLLGGMLAGPGPARASDPTVTIAVTSDAGADNEYHAGDTITVRVTFSQSIKSYTGAALDITIGSRDRRVSLADASAHNSATLDFSYTVTPDDQDTDGITVAAGALAGSYTHVDSGADHTPASAPTLPNSLAAGWTNQARHKVNANTTDYDADDDGLIEISTLAQLNALRWDPDGNGVAGDTDKSNYWTAFPKPAAGMGCPAYIDDEGTAPTVSGAAVRLSRGTLRATEGGAAVSYQVRLNSDPGSGVTATVAISTPGSSGVTLSDAAAGTYAATLTLNFTSSDYSTDQTVYVKAAADDNGADASITVTHNPNAASGDYATAGNATLTLTTTENDYQCDGYELDANLDFDTGTAGDLTDDDYYNGGAGWNPIGLNPNPYNAVFDGNGYTISNLFINRPSAHYMSLFSRTGAAARITGVGLPNANVTGGQYTATLVARAQGRITASWSSGAVSADIIAGGLVGYAVGTVHTTYSHANVTTRRATSGANNGAGSLAGWVTGAIHNSYAAGTVTSFASRGLAAVNIGTITSSYWNTGTGASSGNAGVGKTTAELQSPTAYGTEATDIYTSWNVDLDGDGWIDNPWDFGTNSEYPTLRYGPDAYAIVRQKSPRDPTVDYDRDDDSLIDISTLDQLNAIRYDLDGNGDGPLLKGTRGVNYAAAFPGLTGGMGCPDGCAGYELHANLTFDTNGDGSVTSADGHGYTNWEPLGTNRVGRNFRTAFEGNGYTISYLTIDRPTESYVGLFGWVNSAPITGVGLPDANVTGGNYVGALVGATDTEINASWSSGEVSANLTAGGLVGYAANDVIACYSHAAVGTRAAVGTGSNGAGGLVGQLDSWATVRTSYATGRISGHSPQGLVAAVSNPNNHIFNSYWNRQTSGTNNDVGNSTTISAADKTTSELQTPTAYGTGDMDIYRQWNRDLNGDSYRDNPWDFGTNTEYPTLRYGPDAWHTVQQKSPRDPSVDYDSEDNGLIDIKTLAQLDAIRYAPDGKGRTGRGKAAIDYAAAFPGHTLGMGCPAAGCRGYELKADLDFDTNGDGSVTDADGHDYANWEPIGTAVVGHTFGAVFNGNGHTISYLTIDRPSLGNVGLFGNALASAAIIGVGLPNADVTGGGNVGALAGVSRGTIAASWSSGQVSADTTAGGLVGYATGNIAASYSHAAVTTRTTSGTTTNGAGGLVGQTFANVNASYATGRITSHSAQGLVGAGGTETTITNSYWDMQTTGTTTNVGNDPQGVIPDYPKTTSELQTPTAYGTGSTDIYRNWNLDLDNADGDNSHSTGQDDPWHFGNGSQYPALKYGSGGSSLIHQGRGIVLTQNGAAVTTLSLDENGSDVTYQVAMSNAPAASVTVTVTSGDAAAVTIAGPDDAADFTGLEVLSFTTGNWNTAQTITVRAPDDANNTGERVTLSHRVADAGAAVSGYAGAGASLRARVADDDATSDYDADDDGLIEITTLAQLDAIRQDLGGNGAVSDADRAGYGAVFYDNALDGMGCPTYTDAGGTAPTVSGAAVRLSRGALRATAGGGGVSYNVRLNNAPTVAVTVAISTTPANGDVTFSATEGATYATTLTLYFTSSNWNTDQTVYVKAAADDNGADDSVTLTHNPDAASGDYATASNAALTLTTAETDYVCKGYELTADLDFDTGTAGDRTDDAYYNGGAGWTPIGTVTAPYTGEFHGRGYDIRNLYINTTTIPYVGLFGNTAGSSLITGLGLPDVDITVTYANNTADAVTLHAGALAGQHGQVGSSAVVRSSYSTGSVSVTGSGTGAIGVRAGGLIGDVKGSSAVAASWSSVAVTSTSSTAGGSDLGGLVGITSTYSASIIASYATGDVTANRTGSSGSCAVGGLLGPSWNGSTITASYSTGTPGCTAPDMVTVGGLHGGSATNAASITNSYWDQTTTGIITGSRGAPQTTSTLQSPTAYGSSGIYASWNVNVDGVSGGDDPWNFGGTTDYPILHYHRDAVSIERERNPGGRTEVDYDGDNDNLIDVTTLAQLYAMRYDRDGDGATETGWRAVAYSEAFPGLTRGLGCQSVCVGYELLNHLDFDTDGDGSITAADGVISYGSGGEGWTPIGTPGAGTAYSGEFQGRGYLIRNLYINAPAAANLRYAGLFGAVSGTVEGVGLWDANITVVYNQTPATDHYFDVGALAGEVTGTVRASYSTGAITTSTTAAGSTAPHVRAGGLIGHAETGATVAASWSSATVTSTSSSTTSHDDRVGGLVGTASAGSANGTSIVASYATGDVSAARGSCAAGGLVGNTWNTDVIASYAIGTPTCSDNLGGLTGVSGGTGSISNSYWDSDASGVTSAGAGTAKTTSELQTPTEYGASGDFAAWDVDMDNADADNDRATGGDDPWDFGSSSQYPVLKYGGLLPAAQGRASIELTQSGAAITTLSLTETGGDATYDVALGAAPGAGVTVTVTSDDPAVTINDGGGTFGSSGTLTFTTGNWSTTQTITARAPDDANATSESVTLSHTAADAGATSSGYHGVSAALTVSVTDNDTEVDYDADDDNLIEISTLAQLNAIRHDLNGDGVLTAAGAGYETAFPNRKSVAPNIMGCAAACKGYELTADLDFDTGTAGDRTDDAYYNGGAGWAPIGTASAPYTGEFHGRGYDIRNLYINSTTADYAGLFGVVSGSLITGVGLPAVSITAALTNNTADPGTLHAGALAGLMGGNTAAVRSSYATGSISLAGAGTGDVGIRAGGLIGDLDAGTVAASWSSVAVTAASGATTGGDQVGGLVGISSTSSGNQGFILASYATGNVSADRNFCRAGGLVGYAWPGTTLSGSYSIGTPDCGYSGGTTYEGGLVGQANVGQSSATITNSYWDQTASGITSGSLGTARTTSALQSPTGYNGIYANWNVNVDGVSGGDNPWNFGGSTDYPTLHYDRDAVSIDRERNPVGRTAVDYDGDNDNLIDLTTLAQLEAIRYDPDGAGVTDKGWRAVVYAAAFPGLTRGMGCPAGCEGYELQNHLDFTGSAWASGDGWLPIIDGSSPYNAKFVGHGYTIANLHISRSSGTELGLFEELGIAAEVTGVGLPEVSITGSHTVGALAGVLRGRVSASWSTGSVSASHTVGGLVGRVGVSGQTNSAARLEASYSRASVAATSSTLIGSEGPGGLAGQNYGAIASSYAAGAVTGANNVAGGGLVGHSSSAATVTDSYWDTTVGPSSSGGSGAGGTGRTTAQMQSPTDYGATSSDTYYGWNVDVDNADGNSDLTDGTDDPWDFGHSGEYPALKYGVGRSLIKQGRNGIVLTRNGTAINALAVDEGDSAGVSYAVQLADPPAADVTVTIAPPSGNTAVTIEGPDPDTTFSASETVSFTTTNWNQAQTVTVKAADDTNLADDTVALTHTGADATSAASGYGSVSRSLNLTVTDTTTPTIVLTRSGSSNTITTLAVAEEGTDVTYDVALSHLPLAGVTVTVSSGDSTAVTLEGPGDADTTFTGSETVVFTTQNWNQARSVSVRGVNDGDSVHESVTLTHRAADTTSGSASGYGSISRNLTVSVTDNDTPSLVVDPTSLTLTEATTGSGHQGSFDVRLNTLPTGTVMVDIASNNDDVELRVGISGNYGSSVSLTFDATGTNIWSTDQTVNVQARPDDDGENDSAALTFTISGGNYGAVTQSAISVTVDDDDDKGITFDPAETLTVGEGTDTGSYTVQLATEPTGAVTVSISSNNSDVTVRLGSSGSFGSTASLSFSTTNWSTAQTVQVKAAEDNDSTNDSATLTHTADGGGYGDPDGPGTETAVSADLSVTVTDDDTPGIRLSRTALTITEQATRQTYTVRLNTLPSAAVTVAITKTNDDVELSTDDSTYGTSASLSFSVTNWNTPQTVYVKAADDANGENEDVNLTHESSGGDYNSVSDATLALTVTDNDTKAITLSVADLSEVNENTDTTTYTVRLATEPTASVTVAVSSDNPAAVRVKQNSDANFLNATSLTFTTVNYATAQTITVEAREDANSLHENVTISHVASSGGYGDPDDTGPLTAISKDLSVGVKDNDTPGLNVSASSVSLNEATTGNGHQSSFNVRLNTEPTAAVTVRIASSNDDVDLRVGSSGSYASAVSLSFATTAGAGGYDTDQAVNVRAGQDLDGDNDTASLSFNISGGDYGSVTQTAVSVTVDDDDPKGISIAAAATPLAVSEGAAPASYTVVLDTQPSGTARVAVSSSDPAKVSVSRRSGGGFGSSVTLSFNRANYGTAQTVYARGNADDDTVSETGISLAHTASGGGYAGIAESLSVALTDTSTPALVIAPTPLSIKESTDGDYTVRLATQPASAVTVTISRGAGVAVTFDHDGDGRFGAGNQDLTFTDGNWNRPQAVKVRAPSVPADDTATLSHAASGADYGSVSGSLTVNVRDNLPPVAEAGAHQQAYSGQTITLDGSATDPDDAAATLSYSWRQSGGTPTVTLAGANTARPSFTVPTTLTADTEVEFELTVTDPSGRTDTDTVRATLLAARPNELVSLRVSDRAGNRPLTPPFASIRRSFEASVGAYATTARIILTPADDAAAVSLAGRLVPPDAAGVRAATVHLAEGSNRYTIVVTPAPVAPGSNDTPLPPVIYVLNIRRQPVPRLSFAPARIVMDEGAAATYTVNLDTRWLGSAVTVAIASDNPAVTVSPSSVRFTPTNWAPRPVTVTAAQDDDGIDDAASINHRASGGHFDNVYGRLRVEIADDDGDGTVTPNPTPTPTPTPEPGATPTPTPTPGPTLTPTPPPGLPTVAETNMAEALLDGHTVTITREAGSLWGVTVALPAALTRNLAITIAPLPAEVPRSSARFGLGMTDAAQSGTMLTVVGAPAGGLEVCLPLSEQLVSEAGDRPLTLVRYDAAAGGWQALPGAVQREMTVCAAGVSGGTYAAAYIITPPLGPASELTATPGDAPGTLILRWTPGAQATMHWVAGIKQSDWDANDFSNLIWTAASSNTTHTLTGLASGAEYVFAIAAGRRVDGLWQWSAWTALARGTPD